MQVWKSRINNTQRQKYLVLEIWHENESNWKLTAAVRERKKGRDKDEEGQGQKHFVFAVKACGPD